MNNAQRVANWIMDRERLRTLNESGMPYDVYGDPILAKYRFCNVRREDDRVTRWLKKNWRDPYAGHPNMVGAMLLARMVNWPPTLEAIGFPEKWNPDYVVDMINYVARTQKAWSAAYIVSTCGQAMDKARYVVQTVDQVMGRPAYTPQPEDTLQAVWQRLRGINGLGAGFIAAQVVADLKYCDEHLLLARDWLSFAVSGPGSRRGLNRYWLRDKNDPCKEVEWKEWLNEMIVEVIPLLPPDLQDIHSQDFQNVMCEWDKYERVRLGEGKPRKAYKPETAYSV